MKRAQTDQITLLQAMDTYRALIDAEIAEYESKRWHSYGEYPDVVVAAYHDLVSRGGKRIRGALTIAGYELAGGTDQKLAVKAAMAIEMLQAYILIIDDIQDRSPLRRGKPSAHIVLKWLCEEKGLDGDFEHIGVSLGINAALYGLHQTELVMASLPTDAEKRLAAIKIMNEAMSTTIHGQTLDIVNERRSDVTEDDVEHVMEWKTAHYTFCNPLQVGMALAGASEKQQGLIVDFAIHAGKAFQITDDILGTFGDPKLSGKIAMDDLKEGKRTLLTIYSLQHSNPKDTKILYKSLGNQSMTESEFKFCKQIIKSSGAYDYARNAAKRHVEAAKKALKSVETTDNTSTISFLTNLADSLVDRSV